MKLLNFSGLLLLLLMLTACPHDHGQSIRFVNNSDVDVYFYLGAIDRKFGGTLYPDTAISEVKAGIPVQKGSFRIYHYYEEDIQVDTLCLFIFDADVYNTCSWDEIKNDYKILRRYDLSLQDIKRLNHAIYYPPTAAMQDIKMYPPYQQ